MKKKYLIFIFVIVGICLFPLSFLKAQVIGIQWNTFLGSSNWDYGRDIALDSSGNIYVTGSSDATWGSPVHAHSIGYDAFVAKVNSNGNMLWNTFLGGSIDDAGHSLASDGAGNVFVTGISEARDEIRKMIKDNFIEIYVRASIESCKKRDTKNMYLRAETGEIKNFTGISDVYEEPRSPALVLDTETSSAEDCAQQVINYVEKNLLKR